MCTNYLISKFFSLLKHLVDSLCELFRGTFINNFHFSHFTPRFLFYAFILAEKKTGVNRKKCEIKGAISVKKCEKMCINLLKCTFFPKNCQIHLVSDLLAFVRLSGHLLCKTACQRSCRVTSPRHRKGTARSLPTDPNIKTGTAQHNCRRPHSVF